MSYAIVLTATAQKQLSKLPKKTQSAIATGIDGLAKGLNHQCKKLSGLDDTYRLRVGDFRIVFCLQNKILLITVIKIAHRKEVYR